MLRNTVQDKDNILIDDSKQPTPFASTSWNLPSSRADNRLLVIYVHIPFCRSKCHFCDWVQPIPKSDLLLTPEKSIRRDYINALCKEIRLRGKDLTKDRYRPYIVYWGGGTASILTETEIKIVVEALNEAFDLSGVAEATIECSPDTISPSKLELFRRSGFNRFSSGVQSLNDERLRQIGRTHSADTARQAVHWAVDAGFEHINIDLMCGLPGESLKEVEQTITQGLLLPITHLSVYPYRPTAGTQLRKQIPTEQPHLFLARQKAAFWIARRLINATEFSEYASGYFGKSGPALDVIMPFQLRLETVAFGSGAVSLLNRQYRGHSKGLLEQYIADPMNWDFSAPASSPSVAFSFLRSGLSIFDGVLRDEWEFQTGVSLEQILAEPSLEPIISYLRSSAGLIEDERGIRLPRESVGNVLIDLTFKTLMAQPNHASNRKVQRNNLL